MPAFPESLDVEVDTCDLHTVGVISVDDAEAFELAVDGGAPEPGPLQALEAAIEMPHHIEPQKVLGPPSSAATTSLAVLPDDAVLKRNVFLAGTGTVGLNEAGEDAWYALADRACA